MISFEEAKRIAAEWLDDICVCTEFTTAYSFSNPRSERSIGVPDASVVVLKDSGKRCSFTEFILSHGGGEIIREFFI